MGRLNVRCSIVNTHVRTKVRTTIHEPLTLIYDSFEVMAEVDWFLGWVCTQHVAEIFYDQVCIIICFDEPVKLIEVLPVGVVKRMHRFGCQMFSTCHMEESILYERIVFISRDNILWRTLENVSGRLETVYMPSSIHPFPISANVVKMKWCFSS